jgi:methylmalonyl-CoA/ethylmalonyl-CoA epimerase
VKAEENGKSKNIQRGNDTTMGENKTKLLKINQVGVVVADMDKAIEGMRKVYGVEPDLIKYSPTSGKTYYGKSADFRSKLVFYNFANIQLELIQPLEGPSVHMDFLKDGNEGLQHYCFSVDDVDAIKDEMAARGYDTVQSGERHGGEGLRFAYFDTREDLGYMIEVVSQPALDAEKKAREKGS